MFGWLNCKCGHVLYNSPSGNGLCPKCGDDGTTPIEDEEPEDGLPAEIYLEEDEREKKG